MSETVFANAKVILPDEVITGSLLVRDGKITEINSGAGVPPGATNCDGDYLAPGLIELHTDNLERHIQPRPKVDWPHTSAIMAHDAELASVGITTVFDALRVGSVITQPRANYGKYARQVATELLDLHQRGALRISHKIHLRAEISSETATEELFEFHPEDRVGIVSVMDHSPGQRQFRDINKLREYMVGKHDLTEEEFQEHIGAQIARREAVGDAHEAAAIAAAERLGAVLASHDDTTEDHVKESAQKGIALAEFPTTHEAAIACHQHNIAVMMGAPNLIRGYSHSGNVAARELAESGTLDILSSDYIPFSLLSGAIRLGQIWGNMARGMATTTRNPARAAHLHDRGTMEEGKRADLLRIKMVGDTPKLLGVWVEGRRIS